MWDLIQNRDQAKYQIIKTLFQAKESITIEALAKETSSSERSIKNYLVDLKTTMDKLGGTIESSHDGITLHLPSNIGIDFFQRRIIRNSSAFKFLQIILDHDHLSSDEVAEKLFMSPSSLQRLIHDLKEPLSSYGLSITFSPYRIVGDELLIRRFYSNIYSEAYSITEWPFNTISEDLINKLLNIFLRSKNIQIDFIDYKTLRIDLVLDIIRNKEGYLLCDTLPNYKIPTEFYSKVYSDMLKRVLFENIDPDEAPFYADRLSHRYIYYSIDFFEKRRKSDDLFNRHVSEVEKSISDLIQLFDLPTFDLTNLLMDLNELLSFYSTSHLKITSKNYILSKTKDYFIIDIFQKSFPFFYDAAKEKLTLLCSSRKIETNDYVIENLMHILLTRWENLTLTMFERYRTCKILVYNHLNYRHAENITKSLYTNINRPLEIEIYKEHFPKKEHLSKYSFDILVSTTTLFLDIPQKIHYLHHQSGTYYMKPLVHLIDEVISKKCSEVQSDILASQSKY